MRYRGQAHELTVRGRSSADALREAFAALHEERYGYRDADGDVEVVDAAGDRRVDPGAEDRPARATARGRPIAGSPDGWRARADDTGTLILERAA